MNPRGQRPSAGVTQRLERGAEAATMVHVVLNRYALLLNREFLFRSHISGLKVASSQKFLIPALQRILRRVTQLANGRPAPLAKLDVQFHRP